MNYKDLMGLKDIYLEDIFETKDNYLRLTFSRSKLSKVSDPIIIDANHSIKVDSAVDIDYSLPLIQIDFDWYIGYSVLNESYTVWDDYQKFEGKSFRIYTKSRYLDFINAGTIASIDYPGPFKHYKIVCLNHIIDIVSTNEPIIKEIQRQDNNI